MAYTLTDQDKQLANRMAEQRLAVDRQNVVAKPKDNGNWFTNSLSTVGGILGGIGGSFFGPGIGTAAGGAVGAGAGKWLENLFEGNKDLGDGVLGEAAFGTLGGIGKGVKAISGAAGALKGGGSLRDAGSILRSGVPRATEAASTKGSSMLGRFATRAQEFDAKTSGMGVGQKLNGQVITPKKSQELYEFARSRGVNPGSPIGQARQAEQILQNTTKSLDDSLNTINRSVTNNELADLTATATRKVRENAAVTGSTKTLGKFSEKIAKAKDIKALEAIRREADDLAYSATGAKKTSAAAQAKAVRETIDDFLSAISPDYKVIKGDYRNAKDILELTTKNAGSGKGGLDILGNKVGSSFIPAAGSKGSAILAKAAGGAPPPPPGVPFRAASGGGAVPPVDGGSVGRSEAFGGIPNWMKIAGMQLGGRALTGNLPGQGAAAAGVATQGDGQLMQTSSDGSFNPATPGATNDTFMSNDPNAMTPPTGQSIYTREAVAKDIQNDLATTGGANMDKYITLFNFMNPETGTDKPLSAEASKVIGNANSGLRSLGQLSGMIDQGGVPMGTLVPGRDMLGGLGASVLGTSGYDTAAKNIADVITRLRTGAALTESEEKFYKGQLPQAFDPPEVRQQKLQMFEDLFTSIANQTGGAGTDSTMQQYQF